MVFKVFLKNNKLNIFLILVYLVLPFIFFEGSFRLNTLIQGFADTNNSQIPILLLKINTIKALQFPF